MCIAMTDLSIWKDAETYISATFEFLLVFNPIFSN